MESTNQPEHYLVKILFTLNFWQLLQTPGKYFIHMKSTPNTWQVLQTPDKYFARLASITNIWQVICTTGKYLYTWKAIQTPDKYFAQLASITNTWKMTQTPGNYSIFRSGTSKLWQVLKTSWMAITHTNKYVLSRPDNNSRHLAYTLNTYKGLQTFGQYLE